MAAWIEDVDVSRALERIRPDHAQGGHVGRLEPIVDGRLGG